MGGRQPGLHSRLTAGLPCSGRHLAARLWMQQHGSSSGPAAESHLHEVRAEGVLGVGEVQVCNLHVVQWQLLERLWPVALLLQHLCSNRTSTCSLPLPPVCRTSREGCTPSSCATANQPGGFMRHFLRFCSISAIHSGTCVTWLGLNGPKVPCFQVHPKLLYIAPGASRLCLDHQGVAQSAPQRW